MHLEYAQAKSLTCVTGIAFWRGSGTAMWRSPVPAGCPQEVPQVRRLSYRLCETALPVMTRGAGPAEELSAGPSSCGHVCGAGVRHLSMKKDRHLSMPFTGSARASALRETHNFRAIALDISSWLLTNQELSFS